MSNQLIVRYSKKAACGFVYLASTPIRLAFCVGFTAFFPLFIIIAGLLDLHNWGCNDRYMSDWDDWKVLEFTKLTYWDFLIMGRWPEL